MKIILCAVLALSLTACATRGAGYVPLVDTKGANTAQLAADTVDCQLYAEQKAGAGTGAVAGAVVGALIGAFLMPRGFRNYGAGQGAMVGALGGAVGATESQETIIKRCLQGRGFNVLN